MNKIIIFKALSIIFKSCLKILAFSLKVIFMALLSSEVDKKIKEHDQWENEYDEHTAEVTKRNFLY